MITRKFVPGVAAFALLLSACSHYHVHVPEPREGTEWQATNMNSYLWGQVQEDLAVACRTNSINDVRFNRGPHHVVATIVTLGIWSPIEVQYRCARPPMQEGDGEEFGES